MSRTIRYQLVQVRRYVADHRGRLIGEASFLEVASDRGTSAIEEELRKVAALCIEHKATLLFVKFSEAFFWRPHLHLLSYLNEHMIPNIPLPPEPILIEGKEFDPVKHFRYWQLRQDGEAAKTRQKAKAELIAVMGELPDTQGRYQAAADTLNQRGVTTARGSLWTPESVRKAFQRSLNSI